MEALIAESDVADVCLPTDLHLDAGLRAIAAGRAVCVDQPLARTLEEAVRVVEASERAGVPTRIGHVVRFFPDVATGNRLVKSGAVGIPAAARTRRGGGAPAGSGGWFMDHSRSGGVLLDLAIHDFDWLRWTLGEVKSLYARSVGARTGQGPDYALTTLTFESGAVGHVEATWMDPSGFRTTFEVAGSGGLIEHDSRQNAALRTHAAGKSAAETPADPADDPYYQELRGFLDAIGSGDPPPVTAQDGLMALRLALAALESAKTGQVVTP